MVNTASTVRLPFIVTVQVVPEQTPWYPLKVEPVAAVAFKVTLVPSAKTKEQVVPQLMPAGVLVTVPEPSPDFVTVSV